ncbi:glucocorticoid-induced transcript 1 protein-like isoform X2 [Phymastichus coffea]|uniref:glucocorticoid-induced transcript 1 protein-like isoform X2 n=1 Tax=Phymastichus coffea TaxID=108790 RepID=UPI00273B10C5|nr:glucocorticoid-induced transcript 1 protein-like isoform X2 [Phymastichus coffea]
MSGSSSAQRVRKSSPCSTAKQGPMRATLPVSSLLRQSRQQQAQPQQHHHHHHQQQPQPTPSGQPLRSPTASQPAVSAVSPTNSWRSRISPETSSSSSGQRSPGSLSYKGYFAAKSKTLSGRCTDALTASQNIRRTASLDTIYLKGQWPRDSHYIHTSLLVDKATQTEEWPSEPQRKSHNRHTTEQTIPDEKLEKYFRHRLQRTNKEGTSSRERTAAFGLIMPGGPPPALPGDHSVLLPSIASQTSNYNQYSLNTKASPMNIPIKPMRPPMRSSIEGLNQEIEGLVLKSSNNPSDPDHQIDDKDSNIFLQFARYRDQITPEGHRAPLADLFRANRNVNSVNTQTPATDIPSSSYSSGPPSRNSESPLLPGLMDVSRPSSDLLQGGSRGSTPEQEREGRLGTSPHINRFLAREPPDGCEKVNTKFVEDIRRPVVDLSKLDYCSKPCVAFQLKPSLGSAFLPLQQQVSSTVITNVLSSPQTTPITPPPKP